MEEKHKKLVLMGISVLGMGIFVFFSFIKDKEQEFDSTGMVNPAELDNSPSKQEIYAEKRVKDRKAFDYDRRVSSLDDFLKDQIHKDPFKPDSSHIIQKFEGTQESSSVEQTQATTDLRNPTLKVERINRTSTIPISSGENEKVPRRRVGFASGGVESLPTTTDPEDNPTGVNVLAVVQENATISTGSFLKLRVIESFDMEGVAIPRNTFVLAEVLLTNDRIYLDVETISVAGHSLPANLTGYDLNGHRGIPIEGGLDKEIKRDVLEQTISEVQRSVEVPILKNVPFSSTKKKIRDPDIPITAGHKLYLRNK